MGALEHMLKVLGPLIDYIATHHRPLAMILFVLPASFVTSVLMRLRDWVVKKMLSVTTHAEKVARVQKDVKARLSRPESERRFMCTARAPWQNLSTRFADYKKNSDCIFVGDLNNILHLDEEKLTVELEPLVDVGQITKYLLPKGYMLATTLEIEEATIGGLAMAVGMTTASHKYGLLQETVEEYEVVLGDGRVVTVTKDNEFSDLYYALPWSHGSLCLLLKLRLKVIPVKPYVEVRYTPVTTGIKDYCEVIRKVSLDENPADFVEATVFNRKEAVVMTGTFVNKPDRSKGAENNVGLWYKPWFYIHVRNMLKGEAKERVEYVPTYEYIFRHNRGIFWTLKDQLPEKYGNNLFFRYLLGWLCPPKVQFLKLPATPAIRKEMMTQRVYQDIVLPLDVLEEAVEKAADLFEIWPILVYPSRVYDHGAPEKQGLFRKPRSLVPGKNYGMYFDLGVYGIPPKIQEGKPFKTVTCMREMEAFTRRVGGCPFLYADTFMDREEFNEMVDLTLYEKVREKYESNKHFPHVFDKTSNCQSYNWVDVLEEEQKLDKKMQ